jgi:hypothetical protein
MTRLGCKGLPETSTLAYFQSMEEKQMFGALRTNSLAYFLGALVKKKKKELQLEWYLQVL